MNYPVMPLAGDPYTGKVGQLPAQLWVSLLWSQPDQPAKAQQKIRMVSMSQVTEAHYFAASLNTLLASPWHQVLEVITKYDQVLT